ncbi:tail fiber protein [Niabella hibiscisoli]|uniref:tail fiber protein n=1 Tax=Niabella hibiscisoli TaxID=1825928 RepID=UPI001F0FEB54|nr:tail fiber protein [Niabella hibiscisoli]MCH5718186.1 tail fiber protein [Niabella hibiscisoli]
MNNKIKTLLLAFIVPVFLKAQTHTDQNGWKTSVSNPISASAEQAMRYEIATIGYNSAHWQPGGLIFIELFHYSYATGYSKYVLENGYGQGALNGTPVLRLVENYGAVANARVLLGTPVDLATSYIGQVNRKLPVYVDVRSYSTYKVKITYLQERVDIVDNQNQLGFNIAPTGTPISDFTVSGLPDNDIAGSGNLKITGPGHHFIKNGNVGIGTRNPTDKLSVKGKIRAQEIKVEADNGANWPDYVFKKDYKLPSLADVEKHILEKGHLPEVPSAEEVEKEGIALGANQALLLKKIEELTLYLIEKDKQLKTQQLVNEELEKDYNTWKRC